MEHAERLRGRKAATIAVAGAHFWLGFVGFLGRLNYTVPSEHDIIEQAASSNFWAPAHLIVGALLLIGTYHDRGWEWRACSASFAVMAVWTFFNLMWGLTVVSPVALAAPGLATLAAVGSQLLARAWIRGRHDEGR